MGYLKTWRLLMWYEGMNRRSYLKELEATVAFDAVAGRSTGDMLEVVPKGGTVFLYGGLVGYATNIDPADIIYQEKQLKGFLLFSLLKSGNFNIMMARMQSTTLKVCAGLDEGGWSSSQFLDTTLENAYLDLMKLFKGNSTGKKLRIRIGTP